jgi:hypothetical protein
MTNFQVFRVDDVTVERRCFPSGDVITITAITSNGKAEVDFFIKKTFAKELKVSEVANDQA